MSTVSITKLYDLLSDRVGRESAETLTSYIESKIRSDIEYNAKTLATKEDLAREIARLDVKISDSKSDIIRWMFIFWIGQLAATFGFILLFLKK